MTLLLESPPLPLRTDADGVVRVGSTRVTLDTVVEAFNEGAAPEEIVQQYPSVVLGDIYAVIAYYLRNRATVDEYVEEGRQEGQRLRESVEAHSDTRFLRKQLLARRAERGG